MDLDLVVASIVSVVAAILVVWLCIQGYLLDRQYREADKMAIAVYASLRPEDGGEFTEEDWKDWVEVTRGHGNA